MADLRLRHARRADLAEVADLWMDAFSSDAFHRWVVPDDDRYPAYGREWMRFILDLAIERGHTYVADPLDVAVAWIPPDLVFAGPEDIGRGVAIVERHAGEAKAQEVLETIRGAGGHSITEPHWTLQYFGVRSSLQGRGLGAAVVDPMLARITAERLPCGLVSSTPRNVPFYERRGFTVVAEVPTPDEATALRPMHRPVQGSSSPP